MEAMQRPPNSESTRLVIVRHGQTGANAAQLLHGMTNHPLDQIGRDQARRVAARLATETPADAVLSSPLLRALETARIIANEYALEVRERNELVEMNFGDLEGYTMQQLLAEYPNIASLALDPANTTLTWPNGDNVAEFHRRSRQTFSGIANEFQGQTVIIVSHNGLIGSYLSWVVGLPQNDWQAYRLTNCGISIVDVSAERADLVVRDDCAHLDVAIEPFDPQLLA